MNSTLLSISIGSIRSRKYRFRARGPYPIKVGQRAALIIRNRHERCVRKSVSHYRQVCEIETAVKGGDKGHVKSTKQWQMYPVQVRVDHTEIVSLCCDAFQ
jgi:hypothetical protein